MRAACLMTCRRGNCRPLTARERRQESDLIGQVQAIDERISNLAAKADPDPGGGRTARTVAAAAWEPPRAIRRAQNELTTRYPEFAGRPATLEEIQAALPADTAFLGWLDYDPAGPADRHRSPYHWACVIRRDRRPTLVPNRGYRPQRSLVAAGRQGLSDIARKAARRDPGRSDHATGLARRLEQLARHLKGITHLILMPSPGLAGIPIEALFAALPADTVPPVISYAPSCTTFLTLSKLRNQNPGKAKLLALGDPAFALSEPEKPPPRPPNHGILIEAVVPNGTADIFGIRKGDVLLEYNGTSLDSDSELNIVPADAKAKRVAVTLWRNGETRHFEVAVGPLGIAYEPGRTAAGAILAQRAAATALEPLTRSEASVRLPGTRREVEAIARLFPDDSATTMLAQATETAFQRLAQNDILKEYRFLHLATHGKADPNVAMTSALLLATDPPRSDDPLAVVADGKITAQQIVNTWNLNADLVVLSACESGLGRYADGEGYLGFTQALFVKGARSVVLSLWKVDDLATSLLMRRFYENLLGKRPGLTKPMPKAESLAEAKAWFCQPGRDTSRAGHGRRRTDTRRANSRSRRRRDLPSPLRASLLLVRFHPRGGSELT